jgi:hypothetical protein
VSKGVLLEEHPVRYNSLPNLKPVARLNAGMLRESRRLIEPRRRLSCRPESKGAAVKRPLAGTICSVMKCSPGAGSSTDIRRACGVQKTTALPVIAVQALFNDAGPYQQGACAIMVRS